MTEISAPDLKDIRNRLGWSQQKLADALGIDRSNVSRIEAGVQRASRPVRILAHQLISSSHDVAPVKREASQ